MAELYSVYKGRIPKEIYINSVNTSLKDVKNELIKKQLEWIVCQVENSSCDYVILWEGPNDYKKNILEDIIDFPNIFYDSYPTTFFKCLDKSMKIKIEKINTMSYETKLYNFFNENISNNNRTEMEDEVGNKIVTFFVIDDVAISFVFNNNNDLIACTKVY